MRFRSTRVALVVFALAACGGGSEGSDQDTGPSPTTSEASSEATSVATSAAPVTGDQSSSTVVRPAGNNSITYTISGGYEARGEAAFVSAMSFFDNGVWTMAFGDDSGGVLLLVNLDPSTPSVNFANSADASSISGSSTECDFEVTRQDASGAAGSFTCSDVAAVVGGALTQADNFSGAFDINP